jgi:hypothetical protein
MDKSKNETAHSAYPMLLERLTGLDGNLPGFISLTGCSNTTRIWLG